MTKLKFSICKDTRDAIEPFETALASFDKVNYRQVHLHIIPWQNYKQEIAAIGIYGQGMDVSQVGAPVIKDLIAMNSLRPFTQDEVESFGGLEAFAPVAWDRMLGCEDEGTYAIPWIVDPRAIIYWRDMLGAVGIDEATAFTSFENMEHTFERLQAKGYQAPWAVATANRLLAFQTACTWVWGNGGEIGNQDKYLFDRPEAINGFVRYFELYRFMPQGGQNLQVQEVGDWFHQRKIAAFIGSSPIIALSNWRPEFIQNLGVTLAPGPTYVGGSSLIIWRNSSQMKDAVALVRHLTSHEAQMDYVRRTLFLSARTSVLNDGFFRDNPLMNVFVQSVLQGRTYANLRLSGLIEDMLANVVGNVWGQIIANPRTDIKSALMNEIEPIARRVRLWSE